MKSKDDITRAEAIAANIYVHSFLARTGEYQRSPHFRAENQERIRGILASLRARISSAGKTRMLDFGCGTGFVIALATPLFDEIHGVDITPDMMRQVDLSSGKVSLCEALAEQTPFVDGFFDFASAYSFMDHLFDYQEFLREAYRVLKPGGILYSDLNPNRDFIAAMVTAEAQARGLLSPLVMREIRGALHNGAHYEQSFGLIGEVLEMAEPIKSFDKGFDASEVLATASAIGFSVCEVEYEWFLGQGVILHEESAERVGSVDRYLRSVLPVSSALYKYLRFVFVK